MVSNHKLSYFQANYTIRKVKNRHFEFFAPVSHFERPRRNFTKTKVNRLSQQFYLSRQHPLYPKLGAKSQKTAFWSTEISKISQKGPKMEWLSELLVLWNFLNTFQHRIALTLLNKKCICNAYLMDRFKSIICQNVYLSFYTSWQ